MWLVNLEGLEMIAVLAMVVLFVKVMEHFGWLADDYGGKRRGAGDGPPRGRLLVEVSAA